LWWLRCAVFAFGVSACGHLVDPPLDSHAVSFTPPSVYARWWAMTESCSGSTGSLNAVSWYVVPEANYVSLNGDSVAGYWTLASNSIVLAGSVANDGSSVRHEMLHALTRTGLHQRSYFIERCGGIVACSGKCLTEGGPPPSPDASAARIASDSLELGVSLVPEAPSTSVDGGFFTLIVSATNSRPYPVVVTLDARRFGRTFFFQMFGSAGGTGSAAYLTDPEVTFFRAGETKHQYFDFSISDGIGFGRVPPATYTIYGGYDGRWATRENVVIRP